MQGKQATSSSHKNGVKSNLKSPTEKLSLSITDRTVSDKMKVRREKFVFATPEEALAKLYELYSKTINKEAIDAVFASRYFALFEVEIFQSSRGVVSNYSFVFVCFGFFSLLCFYYRFLFYLLLL
jgi:hypothetical protein